MNVEPTQLLTLLLQGIIIPMGWRMAASVQEIGRKLERMEERLSGSRDVSDRHEREIAELRGIIRSAEQRIMRIEGEIGITSK